MLKLKLNYEDLSDWVWVVTKTKKSNDMADLTNAVYTKKGNELSWPIEPGVIFDENKIG